jgi:hypothetical protein
MTTVEKCWVEEWKYVECAMTDRVSECEKLWNQNYRVRAAGPKNIGDGRYDVAVCVIKASREVPPGTTLIT